MAKDRIFLYPFPISWLPTREKNENWDYTEGGQKYLVFFLKLNWPGNRNSSDNKYTNYLIIPDDKSTLANEVKKAQREFEGKTELSEGEGRKNCFATSFQNLKLIPNFKTETDHWLRFIRGDGLLVKDTSQVEKYSGSEPFSEITFKVRNQFKEGYGSEKGRELSYEESFSKYGNYTHVLEIEPLNLGIEGLPPITCLCFSFYHEINRMAPDELELTKSELYNSKILAESVGKTFTIKLKEWKFDGKNDEILHFNGNRNYVFNSLKEVEPEKTPENDNPPKPENNPKQTNSPSNFPWKIVISVSLLLIFVLLGVIIYQKKASKKK